MPITSCDKTFPEEMLHTGLFTSDREPTTDQSMDTTTAQFGEPVSFTGVAYLSMSV